MPSHVVMFTHNKDGTIQILLILDNGPYGNLLTCLFRNSVWEMTALERHIYELALGRQHLHQPSIRHSGPARRWSPHAAAADKGPQDWVAHTFKSSSAAPCPLRCVFPAPRNQDPDTHGGSVARRCRTSCYDAGELYSRVPPLTLFVSLLCLS